MSALTTFVNLTLCLLAMLAAGGCARLPIAGTLPEGVQIREMIRVDEDAPFAWHPDGARIAAATEQTLLLYDAAGNQIKQLSQEKPTALAWATDGKRLAAAFPRGQQTMLHILDLQGLLLSEMLVDGHVTTLAWLNSGELLAAALTIDRFSFGSNVRGIIYRWQGTAKPVSTLVSDTTVRPFISNWPKEALYRTFTFTISPLGEEIVYTRLQDPPSFKPYLKIMIRQLQGGAEIEVGAAAIGSGTPRYSADGESILYGDGSSTYRLDPWQQKQLATYPTSGNSIALSPGGRFALIDGRLYGDGKELFTFPKSSHGEFALAGDRLLVRCEGQLYLISGLRDGPVKSLGENIQSQLFPLHKWRSEGLISSEDYNSARERILNQ